MNSMSYNVKLRVSKKTLIVQKLTPLRHEMIHNILFSGQDSENSYQTRNRIYQHQVAVSAHTENMAKLLEKLDGSSPLNLNADIRNASSDKMIVPTEVFPARQALKQYQMHRQLQLLNRSRNHREAALLLQEWRARILNNIKKKMQYRLVYQHLLRKKCSTVLRILNVKIKNVKKLTMSCNYGDRRSFHRALNAIIMHSRISQALRLISCRVSPKRWAWAYLRQRLVALVALGRAERAQFLHCTKHSTTKGLSCGFIKLTEFLYDMQRKRRREMQGVGHHIQRLMKVGIMALLLNRLRIVRQNSDINAKKNKIQMTKRQFFLHSVAMNNKYAAEKEYGCRLSVGASGQRSDRKHYVELVVIKNALRRLIQRTIAGADLYALASTVNVLCLCRSLFRAIRDSRQRRIFHRKVIMEKLVSRKSTIVLSKLPECVVLSCIMKRVIRQLQWNRSRVAVLRELEKGSVRWRRKEKLRTAVRYMSHWASVHRGEASVGPTIISRSATVHATTSAVHSDQRSVTIAHNPRSDITELTDDVDATTVFAGGSVLRSSLMLSDVHFAQYYGGKYLREWVEWTLQRRRQAEEMADLSKVMKHAASVQKLRLCMCWRVYFLFSNGRNVISSVIANAILSAAVDYSSERKIKNVADSYSNELVKRFRYMGETHNRLSKFDAMADKYWARDQLRKAIKKFTAILKERSLIRRMNRVSDCSRSAAAIKKWRLVFIQRVQWMQVRNDAANFLIYSRYFRIFISRVLIIQKIERGINKYRKSAKIKLRYAIRQRKFAAAAVACLSQLKENLNLRHRQENYKCKMDLYCDVFRLRRGWTVLSAVVTQFIRKLRYASNQHNCSLLKRGMSCLKENVNLIREFCRQYQNSYIVASCFNVQSKFQHAISALIINAMYARSIARLDDISSDAYLQRWLLRWRRFHENNACCSYHNYAAIRFNRARSLKLMFTRLRRRVQLASIQYCKIRRVLRVWSRAQAENLRVGKSASGQLSQADNSYYDDHPNWIEYVSEDGHGYYYNDSSGESIWKSDISAAISGRRLMLGLLPQQRLALQRSLRHLRCCGMVTKYKSIISNKRKRSILVAWKNYLAHVKPWIRIFNSYKMKLVINRQKYLPIFFRRWFLNTYPDRSAEKYEGHYLKVIVRSKFYRWVLKYKNGEFDQEELQRRDFFALEIEADLFYNRRILAATLIDWFDKLSRKLANQTLERRICSGRDYRFCKLAMNNLKASADNGYERSVVTHRLDSYNMVRRTQRAFVVLFQLSCFNFATSQRMRIGDMMSVRLQKKRVIRGLLRHVISQQTRRRRQMHSTIFKERSWMREEKKS